MSHYASKLSPYSVQTHNFPNVVNPTNSVVTIQLWTIPAIVGTTVILVVAPNTSNAGGMLIAFYCTQFFLAQGNMIISLVTRNIAGQTKKGITMTLVFVG